MSAMVSRSPADHDRIRAIVAGVDELAAAMERKWGVDRLPRLVNDDLRRRFYSQARKFNSALGVGSPADVDVEGERMRTAWSVLDRQATAAGAAVMSPDVWEIPLRDGRVIALVRTREEQHALAFEGRRVDVFSADEIARLIEGFPEIVKAKNSFPGAKVTNVRVPDIDWSQGDPLPDSMLAAG